MKLSGFDDRCVRVTTVDGEYRAAEMGYEDNEAVSSADTEAWYSPEEQARWGVVGIRLEQM